MPPDQGSTESSKGFFEMLWDCDHCGTQGLLGKSQRHCPECGAKQNPDKRYFPKEGEAKKVDGHVYEGADRHCPSCNAPMGAKAKACTNCGSPLDGAKEVKGVVTAPPPVAKKSPLVKILVIVAIVASVIFAIWYFFIRTKVATMKVTEHSWVRTIAIEEYADLPAEGWRDAMPADARLPICSRRERTTRQVEDGQECHDEKREKKDGTFEVVEKCKTKYRSEPVEDDYCKYRITRWHDIDQRKVSGNGLAPQWPTQDLPSPQAANFLGAKRQGKRTETYTLHFGKHTCDVSETKWRGFTDGQEVKVEVRARSGEIVCDSF